MGVAGLVFLSAGLSIYGDKPNNRTLHYIFKPLTILVLIVSLFTMAGPNTEFKNWVLLGLILSLLGDIFLMLPKDRFIAGLVSFLLAHFSYVAAFSLSFNGEITGWWLLSLIVIGAGYYSLLARDLGKLKIPVLVYTTAILAMVWLAGELYWATGSLFSLWLMIGALIFAVSDASLAWNKFKQPYRGAQLVILSTYFLAQWLIFQAAMIS